MTRNFIRRSMGHKQCVNKKQDVAIDSSASNGGQEKYTQVIFLRLHLRQHGQILVLEIFS
jgi:hypothetical protein